VVEQGVDQRAARVPGRRVDDHPRGLVEDDSRILEEIRSGSASGSGLAAVGGMSREALSAPACWPAAPRP
jgi:hypothetical protein